MVAVFGLPRGFRHETLLTKKCKMRWPRLRFCTLALLALALSPQSLTPQVQPSSPSILGAATSSKAKPKPNRANNGTYVNKQGQVVPRPEICSSAPQGATAQCRDGTY